MDPVSAFSVACGVIQVVDFSTKVVSKSRELYKNGSLSCNEEIENMATRLESLRSGLELPFCITDQSLLADEEDLLGLADKCSDAAKALIKIVRALKLDRSHSKRQALRKSFKALWKKGDIDEIQERLDRYQRVLDTRILIHLRQRLDLVAIGQTETFRKLDGNYQRVLIGLATEQRSFQELRDMIQAETASTKDHVTDLFQQQRNNTEIQEYRHRILESLWFEDIHARQETIHEAHGSTFQWIFTEYAGSSRPGHDFVEWLERGRGTYWISGKAGSGKSTLMNYICEHPQLDTHLRFWSGSTQILSPKFFFWRAGSALQQSSAGLLRSLLYQILQAHPELITPAARTELSSLVFDSASDQSKMIPVWTEARLQKTLQNTLSIISKTHLVCFFIDGLDEINGNQDDLVALIERIIQDANVKVCLSSRPYRVFEDGFGATSKLRLQDLTEDDIQRYVSDKLNAIPRAQSLAIEQPREFSSLISLLVNNAQGVFLWVQLAVKDQINGLRNDDSLKQLQERLRLLPTEIEDLYAHMLTRIDKVYRREAAQFFGMMIQKPVMHLDYYNFSLLDLALVFFERLDNLILSSSLEVDLREIIDLCDTRRKRVVVTCAGLLEVQGQSFRHSRVGDVGLNMRREGSACASENVDAKSVSTLVDPTPSKEGSLGTLEVIFNGTEINVRLVHRTVIDFLREHPQAKSFMDENCPSEFNAYVIGVKVLLAKVRILGFPTKGSFGQKKWTPRDVESIMRSTNMAETMTGAAQWNLCNLIDQLMTQLGLESSQEPLEGHWTVRHSYFFGDNAPSRPNSPSRSASQSSSGSNNSFYSAKSAPENTDPSTIIPERAVDFLGFAAQFGLSLYVREVIESRPGRLNSSTATYLLRCAMLYAKSFRAVDYNYSKYLELIATLVGRGGKPNAPIFSTTIWISFLEEIFNMKNFARLTWPGRETPFDSAQNSKKWAIAAKTFLENGAKVHEIIDFSVPFPVNLIADSEILDAISGDKLQFVHIEMQLSILSTLEQCLEGRPEWANIHNLCNTKGARFYSKCTRLTFQTYSGDKIEHYEHSQQRLNEFFVLYEQCNKPYETLNLSNIKLKMARLIVKSYNDARKEAGVSQSDSSSDSDSNSDGGFDDDNSNNEANLPHEYDGQEEPQADSGEAVESTC